MSNRCVAEALNVFDLRDMWPGKLLVKGILTPKDAELTIAHGADGIIVSNHGGRNFDSSMAPIAALGPIVDAVGNRTTVIVVSGFRRGRDVMRLIKSLILLVGARGFEPPTTCTPCRYATRLRYAPKH